MILMGIIAGGGGSGGGPVVGADLPHRYWRLLLISNSGDPFYSGAQEIKFFRYTNDGANMLPYNGDIVTTVQVDDTFYDKEYAYNKDPANRWRGFNNPPANWFQVDFAVPVKVGSVEITAPLTPDHDEAFSEFFLQFSDDGSSWTSAYAETGNGNLSSGEVRRTVNPAGEDLTGVAVNSVRAFLPSGRIVNGVSSQALLTQVLLNRVSDAVAVSQTAAHIVLEP